MSCRHDDYRSEPVPGLPETLPPGERILWQGAPQWRQLATEVFHIRATGLYLISLTMWRADVRYAAAHDVQAAILTVASLLPVAAAVLGLLVLLAWLASRTTLYTVTNRRVVVRAGIALPLAINIPFRVIRAAGLRPRGQHGGDIALSLIDGVRVGYVHLWPHVRPWRLNAPEPMLRALPDAAKVGSILGAALCAASPGAVAQPLPAPTVRSGTVAAKRAIGQPQELPASLGA